MRTFLNFIVLFLLNITVILPAFSQLKRFCGDGNTFNYRNSSTSSSTSKCDSASLYNYYPYDSTDIKNYYLHFYVQTDSAGNAIGGITTEDIDFLIVNTKNILNPVMFDFCYSVEFSNSVIEDSLSFKEQINYVYIRDCGALGLSGNPICLDYVAVMDSASFGGQVLAHEIGHNWGLLHVSDASNLMYPSGGGGEFLENTQIATMHCMADQSFWQSRNHPYFHDELEFGNQVCNNFGAPYTRFYPNTYGGCVPLQVSFSDFSSFIPDKWYWDFGDGFSDTTSNPVHTYLKAGLYNVTLITSNDFGLDTFVKSNYITVTDSLYTLPFYEGFENSNFPPSNWYFKNSDDFLMYFEKNNNAVPAETGSSCIKIIQGANGYSGYVGWPPLSDKNSLISPLIDFKYVIDPYITFNKAYPMYDELYDDSLQIYFSSDCGQSYTQIYGKINDAFAIYCTNVVDSVTCKNIDTLHILGTILLSEPNYDPFFFAPQASSEWRQDSINLNFLEGKDSVIFKFTVKSFYASSYLYLDDILISADKISGLPVADFIADTTTIYQNDTVHFTNLSTFSDTLQWFFTGATIATTQDTNPSVVYDSVGVFPVTLVVWNMFGRDTLTKLAYINVLQKIIDTIPCDSMKIILSKNDLSCKDTNDGTVTVSAFNGNSNYSFSWSNGSTLIMITGLAEGTYTVTVTDSIGCTKTDSVKISYIDSLPAVDFSYTDTGYAVIFTNLSTNADSYLWQFGDDSTDNSPNPNHIYFDFGTYEACLIAMNNCGADTLCKSISIIEGIKENTGKINLKIFPNPNSGTFTIIIDQSTASEIQITLTNILGQKIYTNTVTAKIFKDELNLTNFSKGIYSLKLVTDNGSISRKVVYR